MHADSTEAQTRPLDLSMLGGPAAVGAAAASLRRGWRVRMVELGIDDVPRAWWRIGPTPWFPEPIDGYAFEDRSVAQLGSMGDFKLLHEGTSGLPIPESRHFVYAPMGASPFPGNLHGLQAAASPALGGRTATSTAASGSPWQDPGHGRSTPSHTLRAGT